MPTLTDFELLACCDGCTSGGMKKVYSFLTNPEKVDILIIGQSPNTLEEVTGRPFVGISGNLVNGVATQYSKDIAYINTVLCHAYDAINDIDRMPNSIEIKSCRGRFVSDFTYVVDNFNPKIVAVFGSVAKKAVGLILKDEKYSKLDVHYFEHPHHILRNDHLKDKYITNLHNEFKSVFNTSSLDEITKTFVIYDDSMSQQFLDDVKNSRNIGVDIETNKLNVFDPTFIIGTVAVSCDKMTYFFDFREKSIKECDVLIEVLGNKRYQKIFANIMFDVVAFECDNYDIRINNYTDLFPLAFMFDNTYIEYNLESITMRYFPELASYKSGFQSTIIDNDYLGVNIQDLMKYNCFDAFVTKKLFNYLYDKSSQTSRSSFDRINTLSFPAIINTKISGMKVDVELLDEYLELFKSRLEELSEFFKQKHKIQNINSQPQVSKWLFEDLKLEPVKYNKPSQLQKEKGKLKGTASTDKTVIEIYAVTHPDVKLLYEARRVANLINYTLKSIKDNVDFNGFIHPNYKHYGIQSYRLSCLAPNLQGISRDKTGLEFLDKYPIRRLFQSREEDTYIVEFDYSQQEVRIIAELARDKGMLEAFERGDDIHRFVASMLFRKEQPNISEFERQVAKGCVFGAIFGSSAKEMAIKLRISTEEAQAYLNKFFVLFPGIKNYIERQHKIVLQHGVVVSVLGQPRRFKIHRNNINDSKREAANHGIQSVAAGITFIALRMIHDKLVEDGQLNNGVWMIHTVHDSIIFDVNVSKLKYILDVAKGIMSSVPSMIGFNVKFPVDEKIGKRWGENLKLEDVLNKEEVQNVAKWKV